MATACQTIGAAVEKASAGDTIIIASGIYTESILLNKDLTLIGFGSDGTILSGGGTAQVLYIPAGVSASVYDVAVVNGYGNLSYGAGIFNAGTLTLTHSLISNNNASGGNGGGIRNEGKLVVDSSQVSGNSAGDAGGIGNIGLLTINHSAIHDNQAFDGGGIQNRGGTVTVNASAILHNSVHEFGGGVDNYQGNFSLNNSVVANNLACNQSCPFAIARIPGSKLPDSGYPSEGGGIWSDGGALTVTNSTISTNTVLFGDSGGLLNNSHTIISNTTISGNTANYAAGIYNVLVLTLTNVTISGNVNEGLRTYGTTWMRNTISGDGCAGSGLVVSLGHNLSSDSSCNLNAAGDLTNTNPLLGTLQDNGGPTPTHALLAGSPAINHGDNLGCPPTDQRGVTRPQAGICDIGAYEYVFPFTMILPIIRR